jgi:hypothetical protein
MTKIEKFILFVVVLAAIWAFSLVARAANDALQPTELQTLKLQLKQRDAQVAQKDVYIAQQNFQRAVDALRFEAEQVKIDNKWPQSVQFDPDTLKFAPPKEEK